MMSSDARVSGCVYILKNNDMPGLLKVGKTRGKATIRARELSSTTGVPSEFEVCKEYHVIDSDAAERRAHQILETSVGRANNKREFFFGPLEKVVALLDEGLSGFIKFDLPFEFEAALEHLGKKEFTLGCLAFEAALTLIPPFPRPSDHRWDAARSRILGAYLACCCAINRNPLYVDQLLDVRIKNSVMRIAIDFARGFDSEPEVLIISFVRSFA
jgi:hypothetical protein